jgi:hypothetical protein
VIDEKPSTDARTGMNLDTCKESPDLRYESRQGWYSDSKKPMSEPVKQDRVQARVA